MIQRLNFVFQDLTIDLGYIAGILGFSDGELPEPFDEYLGLALAEAPLLSEIHAAYTICEEIRVDSGGRLHLGHACFEVGKTVAKEFRNSESIALLICTAGEKISARSQEFLAGENPVLGYVFDVLGSVIVEAAVDQVQRQIMQEAARNGFSVTNRYSPGYCNWSVADQHKLFSFFPENCCGISLTTSALMHPIKSVSGLIGIGKNVKYREYTCGLCNQVDCYHRIYQQSKIVHG